MFKKNTRRMPPRQKPFVKLRKEAKEWFSMHPADAWRLKVSIVRTEYGYESGNPEKFFRRSIFDVSSADIYRWIASCQALIEVLEGKSDLGIQDDG